jgi:heptosyltransferase-2
MQMSDLCLCNDSGGMHLAAACGLSGVGIFGSTSPVATGPLGSGKWVVVYSDLACSPCLKRQCPLDNPEEQYRCLKEISPEIVYGHLSALLEG